MRVSFLSAIILACSTILSSQVTLPKILSSHVVMQRDLPVHVWGTAAPGQSVAVAFRGESRSVAADPLGHWDAYLKPGAAGGPFSLTVTPGSAPTDSANQPAITRSFPFAAVRALRPQSIRRDARRPHRDTAP